MQRSPTCEHCQKSYELRNSHPVGPRIPLLLPCGHTFCEGCLIKPAKLKPNIKCFTCETDIQLDPKGEAGVRNLLPNIYLLGLLLYNRRIASVSIDQQPGGYVSAFNGIGNVLRKKKVRYIKHILDSDNLKEEKEHSSKAPTIVCDECSNKYATCQCKQCEDCKFCDGCFLQVHRASKTLNKHTALPLEYPSKEDLSCSQHVGRSLEFFDEQLNEFVCAMCIITEKSKGHSIIPVSEMKNDSNEELEAVVEKAKDTLSWFHYSSKILSKALPEEAVEANQFFTEIHSKFTACHTLLLKREMQLMTEATDEVLSDGHINNTLQELSEQTRKLKTILKDYEMIADDKRVMIFKTEEFLKRLKDFTNSQCIIQRTENADVDFVGFNIADSTLINMDTCGIVKKNQTKKFIFKTITDVPQEERDLLKKEIVPLITDEHIIKSNEIANENVPLDLKQPSRLTLMSGRYERIYVTHVNDPTDFKIQRCADKDRLQVMMSALNKYCRHSKSHEDLVYTTQEGQFVCAQFLADNNWYRARVTNGRSQARPDIVPTWQNGLSVEVLYIDYGNSEWLPLNRLRQLQNHFLDVPEMAVTCSLTDIVPKFKEVIWPERAIKAFNSLTGDRPMLMNIRKRIGGKLYVDLRKPDDDEPTLDDDRPISVRDALVFLEVAVFFSPASQPNADIHHPTRRYVDPPPLERNSYIDITVTHIENPHSIYIQKLDSIIAEEQKSLTKLYTGRNIKSWKIDLPYKNLVCAARFSADKTWYRAVVKKVHINDTVDVEYIDYGNSETISFADVKKIPPMYLSMPIQCWKVKLHDLDRVDSATEWSDMCLAILNEELADKPFVAVVKDSKEDNIPTVELYDTSTTEDINMNDYLVKKGVVKSISKRTDPANSVADVLVPKQGDLQRSPTSGKTIEEAVTNQRFPCYLPAVLPFESKFIATGVHVDNKANIFLHVTNHDDHLTEIMVDLNTDTSSFTMHPTSTTELSIGQACIGKFSQDHLWYRVTVTDILSHKTAMVEFIDFGNTEEVEVSSLVLKSKNPEVPAQCISVVLTNVKPVEEEWSSEAINFLTKFIVSEKINVLCPFGNSSSPYKVEIHNNAEENLSDLLCQRCLAVKAPVSVVHIKEEELHPTVENSRQSVHKSDYLWFSRQNLPNVAVCFDVQVTQVIKPNLFYIQRYPAEEGEDLFADDTRDKTANDAYSEIEQLYEISDLINSENYFNDPQLPTPIVGMACIGKYSEDDLYYRAKIESLNKNDGTATVVFVDYGNSETVSISSLKAIKPEHVHLPMQSSLVTLAGVKPLQRAVSSNDNQQPEWTLEERKQFFVMVANKRMIAEVVSDSGTNVVINLYDRCLTEDSETGETTDVLIGKVLKDNNLAEFEIKENGTIATKS